MRTRRAVLAGCAPLTGALVISCGQGGEAVVDTSRHLTFHDASTPDGNNGNAGNGMQPDRSQDAGMTVPPCSPEAARIYLLDTAGVLHSFDPTLLPSASALKTIGTMNCVPQGGGAWAGASSMAVDRNAVAWVTDRSGLLFKVSTVDASCQPTAFQNQEGFTKVGMGFAGNAALGTETLYVADTSNPAITGTGKGLATIDLASFKLTPTANFDGTFAGYGAELTGSGDGRLFGFFPSAGASLARIDPATAHILSSTPLTLPTPPPGSGEYDFAFSFWGGVFFVYTASTGTPATPTTDVSEFDPATGNTTVVLPQIGFNVLGAGSSTCVPTESDLRVSFGGDAAADADDDADVQIDVEADAGTEAGVSP